VNLSQKVAFNTVLLLLSRLVVAGSGLVGVVVSTRYLGPDGFGKLTVGIVFVSVFGFFTDAGLFTVAAREMAKHPEDEQRILSNVFSMALVITAATLLLALASMFLAYGGAARELVRIGIAILAVQMLASPVGGAASAYLVAHQRVVPAAFAGVLSSAVYVGALFVVIGGDFGFAGIAACSAVSGLIALLVPFGVLRLRLRLTRDPALWRQMLSWALPQAGVLVLGILYFRVDTFLLSFLSTDSEVGLYGVAYRVLEVLIVLPTYFMSTLFPELARQRLHSDSLDELVQGAFSSMALVAVPLVIIFATSPVEVISVAGGPRYADAAPVLAVLAVAVALVFLNTVFVQSLIALTRQRNLFVVLLLVLAGNVLLNVLLIPALGAMGAAIALVATEGAALALVMRAFARVGKVPRFRYPVRFTGSALITGIVVLALREVFPLAQTGQDLGASFTAALVPLGALIGMSVVTVGVWAGSLTLLGAVPPEVQAAIGALRHRAPTEPGPALPTVAE
jgi:O-antigen/teichoic acid export membrane protein